MKKKDIVLIACILAIAGVIASLNYMRGSAWSYNKLTADVFVDGKLYNRIIITDQVDSLTIATDYGKNTIEVHDGGVEMIDADCADKVCKAFAFRSTPGDMIVCLPHHLYVEIKGSVE